MYHIHVQLAGIMHDDENIRVVTGTMFLDTETIDKQSIWSQIINHVKKDNNLDLPVLALPVPKGELWINYTYAVVSPEE